MMILYVIAYVILPMLMLVRCMIEICTMHILMIAVHFCRSSYSLLICDSLRNLLIWSTIRIFWDRRRRLNSLLYCPTTSLVELMLVTARDSTGRRSKEDFIWHEHGNAMMTANSSLAQLLGTQAQLVKLVLHGQRTRSPTSRSLSISAAFIGLQRIGLCQGW